MLSTVLAAYGPTFGGGHDLYVSSSMTQVSVNPHSYMGEKPNQPFDKDWLIGGSSSMPHYQFDELVVYYIESAAMNNFADSAILTGNAVLTLFRTCTSSFLLAFFSLFTFLVLLSFPLLLSVSAFFFLFHLNLLVIYALPHDHGVQAVA